MNSFQNFENIFFGSFGRWFSKIFEKQMTCPLVCLLCSVCSLRLVYLLRSVIWAPKIKCFKSTMARFLTLLALTPPSAAGARPAALSSLRLLLRGHGPRPQFGCLWRSLRKKVSDRKKV